MPKHYTPNDLYFYKAKEQGFRARSAFKLIEIQERYGILKEGQTVLDLGAAPGSFMQVIRSILQKTGIIIGIDLQHIRSFKKKTNMFVHKGDIFDTENVQAFLQTLGVEQVDIITSDLAPKTCGIKDIDQWKSVELNLKVLDIADIFLKPDGHLVMKVFVGEDLPELLQKAKSMFTRIQQVKPKACRDRSFENYIVCFNKNH